MASNEDLKKKTSNINLISMRLKKPCDNVFPGVHLIPEILVKKCGPALLTPPRFQYNCSTLNGIDPTIWKKYFVTSIYKIGDKSMKCF